MRCLFFFLLLTGISLHKAAAQVAPKEIKAVRTAGNIRIDGKLNEPEWKATTPATGFIEYRPNYGAVENASNRTEIYLLYDNTSVYIAGYCHELRKDSVSRELIGRDRIGVNDFVGVMFDTYYDQINAVGFYVTPLGEQYDAKYSSTNGEDDSWNAVWSSESQLVDDGWTFEMRIPYSALRFNSKENQTWGVNITRRRNKTGQQYFWNAVDPTVNGLVNQEGLWTGIEKIEAPVRLSLSPYFSSYLNHYPYHDPSKKNTTASINGGMDAKYGINESFTLDVTLIPDFGQVQSDNQVLNLSPFEVRFNENRSFFTEGTELFSKGNLFYSRRIGGMPMYYGDAEQSLTPGERVVKNPSETKLINATKISGRTRKKLGIGLFNAVTKPMYATIENSNKESRNFQTTPLVNYNIIVFDQSLKNNSSVSFINTNVMRSGSDYDANVSAAMFDVNNKKNSFNWNGKFAVSQLVGKEDKTIRGYSHRLGIGKTGGRLNFNLSQELTDDKYEINDMGLLFNNNFFDHYLWVGYKWINPGKWYNTLRLNYNLYYSRKHDDGAYQSLNTNINVNGQLKNLWWAGVLVSFSPEGNDFYEPREKGRFFRTSQRGQVNMWMESNYAKKYSFGTELGANFFDYFNGRRYSMGIYQNYRFNDHLSVGQELLYQPSFNEAGYYNKYQDPLMNREDVLFSRRTRHTVENVLKAKYNFNNKSGITFRGRHYWSKVDVKQLFDLQKDGSLVHSRHNGVDTVNQNFNAFNIDAVFTLQFAPGSFINIVWKNAIYTSNSNTEYTYFRNFDKTISAPQNNSISFKILYFLDYLDFKKWRSAKAR
jgi:hypothetical protein